MAGLTPASTSFRACCSSSAATVLSAVAGSHRLLCAQHPEVGDAGIRPDDIADYPGIELRCGDGVLSGPVAGSRAEVQDALGGTKLDIVKVERIGNPADPGKAEGVEVDGLTNVGGLSFDVGQKVGQALSPTGLSSPHVQLGNSCFYSLAAADGDGVDQADGSARNSGFLRQERRINPHHRGAQ